MVPVEKIVYKEVPVPVDKVGSSLCQTLQFVKITTAVLLVAALHCLRAER